MGPLARALGVILIVTLHRRCYAITKNFVNSSMPEMRPTFVVNFDMATVICQHSADPSDLHLHQMSILCDGKPDCYKNPAMHDESFPYCEGRCNSTCSGRGACLFDGSRGQCYCNAGFHGPECELIDNNECEDKPCHWLAHCQNTLGSYYCTCFPGFHGNGHECSDIDECSSGIAHCPEYSSCVNLPGTYFCNCSEGFQPLGLPLERCADIDECEQGLHSCVDPLMCQNEVGSYRCVKECSEGYRLVNGSCIDIDECSEKLAECDKRASCTNTIGGYKCTCEEGFAGNGRTCSPVNDCSQQEGICDRHAFCLGSLRMCICQAGYIGDGLSCYDVNECGAKVNPCEGQSGNRCVNIDGGYICCEEGVDDDVCIREKGAFCSGGCGVHAICYNETCQCMDGFEGDPRVKCDDVNECENDKQCAGVGEWCVNMIGGYICCDPESKEEECKAKRSTTSTNDSTTTSELDHEVKGGTRNEQSESVAHESSGGLIVTSGKIISNEYVEIACDIGCPPNSYCENGTCRCDAGYTGNTKQGCHDIDECERSPCTEPDSWCINLPGSFQCCTTQSNVSDCIGLEIVAGVGMRLGDGESHESNVAESSSSNGSIGGRGGKWKVETFGEWRNFSGGAIVIGRGKIENEMWNITGGEGEEELASISDGKKEAERLISLISGLRKGSGPDTIETPDIGTQRFVVVDNGVLKSVGSGSGGAELSASGISFIEKDGDAVKKGDRERTNFTRGGYGTGAARVAVAIGGAQERPILSMNGTITGGNTDDERTWESSREKGVSLQKGTDGGKFIAIGDGAVNNGDHVMMAVGGAPGGPILEMSGAISVGDRKSIDGEENFNGEGRQILKITGDSQRRFNGEGVLLGGGASGRNHTGSNIGGVTKEGEKGSEVNNITVTTHGDGNLQERGDHVHVTLGGAKKEPLFKMNATATNGPAKGTSNEIIGKKTHQTGDVLAGSSTEFSGKGAINEPNKGRGVTEGSSGSSSIKWSEVNVGGELGSGNANGPFFKSGQSSESSYGEIITQNGGSLLIKNVGQPEAELTTAQPAFASTDSSAAEKTTAGKDEVYPTTLLTDLTTSAIMAFTTLVTQLPEIPAGEEGNAAIHREIDEATAAPKTATITSSVTESTQTATAGETNEPLPTTSEKKSSKTAKAPFITETMSKTAEMSSKATATNTSEAELMQITASRPIEEMRPTSEESAKERDTSFGEKRFTSTPASSHRSTEREEEKNGTQNGKGPEEGHNLAQQRMISTTNEPETVVATSLTSLEPTATSAENEQGEKAKYIEGLPTVEQEMISQTTQHSAMKPEEENTTSEQSSEATEAEVGTENSTPAPDSREKVKAEITTKTKTTGTSEIEASTKGVEIDEAMTATKTSESSMSEATTDEERSSEEEDETTLATSTFAGETRSETTVPEDEEEESSTASAEQQGQTSLNPLVKPTQELPRESSEKESSHSEQKEISSTTEVTVSIEVTTTEQDKQTKEASSEQHNEGSDTSASESITTDDKLIVTDATPDASELHSTSSPATTTTTAVESSSITPPEEEQESRRTGAVTIMPTEIESSSTIRGVQETKTLEHKIEDITTTKPAGEYEVTEVDENALIAKLNEQTLSKNGSFTKSKAYTTIEENEHSTTLGPEEGESPTIKDESTQSSTKQIPVSKSSTTQEAAGERTAEAEQTATGVGSYASVKPDGETPLTTYYPHETNESSVKSKEVTEPKADEEVRSTEQPDHGAISTGGEKEMALAAVTASELYTTISKERDGNFENEINTTAPTSESEPPGKPSPKSDNSYEKIVAGGKTSEPPEEEITRKPVDGEQGKEVVLEVVTTTEVSGAEVKTERSEESTTPILEKSTIITKPVQESDKEKKMNQLEDGHEAAQPTSESASVAGSEGPSTKLSPERFAPLSGASTQSAESEISTFTSPSRRADESQPSDDGGTTASLETTSIERTLAVFSEENVTAAAKVETTVHSDESNLPVEKYSNETTSRPKIIGEEKYESTLRGSSDGTTPSVKTVKALPTEAYGISSASETPSTPETGLEIIWVTASSIPEASSSSTSQERGTTAVVLSPSTSTVESIVLRTDHSTKVTTHLLGSSMQSTTVVSEEKASVTPESSSTTSDTNGFAKTEAESSTTVGTKTIKGETEGEGKITSSTPAGSFGSAEVSSSTANFVTDIPESKETNEGDGGLVHVTSATTETTSTTNEEEGSGEVEEVTGKPHTAHISTAVPNEEQPVEGYRSVSLLETTKQPWNRSTEGTIITESHGNTTGQAPRTAADKLHSLTTPDIEQRLHTGNEGMLESSTVVSGPMTEKTITGSAEEERKEGKEADSTNAPIKLSTFETAHFTIGSNGTEETVSKEDSVPRTPLLIVTTPSIEETTIRIGPTMRHGSELFHTTALRTSTSPSSSVGQHGSVVAETTEMIETSGTYTVHAVIESSSTPFAESPAKATATVTPSKETFGKSSEITVTLSPSAEAANEEKQPFTLPSTKIPSTEASQSSSSSGKTETYGPTGMSTTTEIEEKVPKKGVSEPSKVIPPDQQTLSTLEYGHEMFHVASTSTEQPKTTILLELPASETGRKEAAAKKGSGTTENGVGNTHLNATNIASKTNALHPISEQGKFTVIATPEAATALPLDHFTNIGSETTEVTASTTATEDKLSTMPVQEESTIQSESSMMTSSIPIDSSEVGENVPKEKGIPHTPTIASTSTFSSTGEKQINEVTFGYDETTKSTSKVTHSIDKPNAEKGFQSTEETPESTTLDEIAASSVTTAAMSTTTEDSSTSSPSIEITERTVSTTLSSTNEASGETEVTTLLSASESEVPSAEETTATTDASVIRTTLEETVSPKTAKLPERWRTTKETFSLKTTTEESSSNASFKTVRCHSSDHCGLDAYCERRSGACRCFAGFDGAPPQTPCVDVNECERHLDDCHSTARCSNFVGGYTCLCETGYRKNNDGVCVDIDECSERAGSFCHPKATCANLPGSYSCQCIAGYVGDGHTCLPLDKRHCTVEEWEKMDCGRNHLCLVDEYGNGDCDTCKSGFIMRDGSCSDIDECADAETNVCHADAICKNLVGSFTCQCQPGFKGDGFQCIDVDECQQNPCHPHANCINFPGSYTCKCPDGWDGDGTNECINPLDEECRNKEAVCKRTNHTSCLSVRLGELISVCECDANYRYNNETEQCEDIDECEENRHSCDPSTSVCVNTDGGYICECAAGYEGTGGICVDVDECERGLAGCNVAANCENHIGSVGCKCAPGYTGDGIDCTPINVRTSSSNACTQDWIHLCRIENKTCHIDDEDVPQCGSCLVGHQPVGGQCLPINGLGNCADPNKNDCDPNADCIDVHPGRHFCTCKVGYIGDGRHCDDVDECSLPGVCDAAADCHNTNGSFTCVCQPGYSGNGFKCVRSTNANGEPNCHLDPSMCHKKANCLLGGTCKCINGYVGDGITSCEPEDIIKSSSKEQTYSTVSHSSESEKSTSVTSGKTESTTASALKETQHAETSETSTTVLTATSVRGLSKLEEPETISTTTESAEKTFASTTKLPSTEDKKLDTTTEKSTVPASSKVEATEAKTIQYTASSSEAPTDTTRGRGGIALPTEGTDQPGNPYEGTEAEIISNGPPGTSPISEKDLEGITSDKKHETSHTSIASSISPSVYIHTHNLTTEMPEKLPHEEELRRGSEQMQTKKTAGEKEAKLTEEAEKAAEVSAGDKYTGEIGNEITGGKATGGDASSKAISKTSEESDKLTHGLLSGGKAMMGIGVKRTDEVAGGGAVTEETIGARNIEGIAEKELNRNGTGEAGIKGERTVIKIAIGGPEGTLRERTGGSLMSTKMNGRLDSGKGTAKMTGEVHSGAKADKSQVGIDVAKTTAKTDEEVAQNKHGNESASLSEGQKIEKEQRGGIGKLAEEKGNSQHIGEGENMKESGKEGEKASGTKPSEEQTERPHYRTHFIQKCTSTDTSPCHENAKCDVSSGHCVCKNGYYGDGYSACTKITQDCISDADACDTRAVCDVASRRCKCLRGYVGDGLTCFPDVLDCVLRPNLCSDFASCIDRRCVCNEGYTGDGSSCVSLEPVTDCSKCDVRAECVDSVCKCRESYFGNGGTCIADPADCVHYPGLCHRNALCDDESRRCQCLKGFLGDGLDCSNQKKCLNDSTVCHEDADCLPSGVCQCRRGFTGNGILCNAAILINAEEATSAPKFASIGCEGGCHENEECFSGRCHCVNGYERDDSGKCVDIDECSLPNGCHPLAICVNLPGSHACTCPDGYRGDGKICKQYHHVNNMAVDCEMDGMTLVLTNESELFDGRIFVRGQTENPYCSKKLSSIIHNGSDYRFTVPFAHCNVRFEEPDTFAVTVVVQRHPMFITQTADAYDLRCTYPVGSRQVMSHVNVSEMTTADTIVQTGSGPICSLTVTNDEDEVIDTATVGQVLRLALSVQPNDTYAILPRNCFAINLETGERYSLTDQAGCAIDTQLFPEWVHKQASLTTATFRTFKWPDSSMIRFQCDCSACVGSCPKVNCDRRREAIKRRRLRFRYARGIDDKAFGGVDNELERSLVSSAHAMAFSHAVHVDEDEEERRAQREVDNWKYQGFTSLEPFEKNILVERICVRAMWIGVSVLPLLLIVSLLGALSLLWKRKSSRAFERDVCKRTIYASENADNASSYLKF